MILIIMVISNYVFPNIKLQDAQYPHNEVF